jgi:hypothetical protein
MLFPRISGWHRVSHRGVISNHYVSFGLSTEYWLFSTASVYCSMPMIWSCSFPSSVFKTVWPVISLWIAWSWLCRVTQLFLRINCALHVLFFAWSQLRVHLLSGRFRPFINSLSWQKLSSTCFIMYLYVLCVCSYKYIDFYYYLDSLLGPMTAKIFRAR